MRVLDQPLVFVDVETNGLSHTRGRVIEVAAIRTENGEVTASFNQLIDPETDIPPFISQLTGITAQDIRRAPTFSQVADDLYQIIDGAVMVAHNARFDYSFLKQEFRRAGRKFNPKLLCTVRLSRALYPERKNHKLEAIIELCGLSVEKRHRAYDDARATLDFLYHCKSNFPNEALDKAAAQQLRAPSLPKALSPELVKSLPEGSGVYIFEDDNGSPLYIGKSVNIKKRVLSHFSRDHQAENEFKISQQIAGISFISTGGELEALLLESRLIKERMPLYNRMLRRTQKLTLARKVKTANGYLRVTIEDVAAINPKNTSDILAVYTTKGKARIYLEQAVRDHLLCPKLLGLEKGGGPCFLYQLKKCEGACAEKETPEKYNARLLEYFASKMIENWPYKSPISIREPGEDNHKSIIVDQWCHVADVWQEPECSPVVKYYEKAFDIDNYNILRSFIKSNKNRLKISSVSLDELRQGSELINV